MRKIPATMASQHPDHARTPYWATKQFISTRKEIEECFLTFSQLRISEYKWDWEGKFVDESVVERLLGEHFDYFQKHPLGREKFLTFRLPNPKVETEFRLGRAFMGILGAAGLARHLELHSPPLFEVILPMTETAQEIIDIQEAFVEIASLKHKLHTRTNGSLKHIEVIPLFEQVETIMRSDRLLKEYLALHKQTFSSTPLYLRPYVARSDPALNSGIVPTVLAIKVSLSRYAAFERESGIKLYPIIGSASLPFRGGLTPASVKHFARQYAGIRTALLQSAFRYDFPLEDVVSSVRELERLLPKGKPQIIDEKTAGSVKRVIDAFEPPYRTTVEHIAPLINDLAVLLPKRRERVQHIGLFGYSRGVGKVRLPRAIEFTGVLYSLGVPPEFIGTGRGLARAKTEGTLGLVESLYPGLKRDLRRAGKFFSREGLNHLARQSAVWEGVAEDVKAAQAYLGESLGPETEEEYEHGKIVLTIHKYLSDPKILPDLFTKAAVLRRSLG